MTKEESVLDDISQRWLDGEVDSKAYFEDARRVAREDYKKGIDETVRALDPKALAVIASAALI